MRNFLIAALMFAVPSVAFAKTEPDPEPELDPVEMIGRPLPTLDVIGNSNYIAIGFGGIRLDAVPGKDITLPILNIGGLRIDENYLYFGQVSGMVTDLHQYGGLTAGVGFGPRFGWFHGGVKLTVSYSHLFDDSVDKYVHGVHVIPGLIFAGTVPIKMFLSKWHFFFTISKMMTPFAEVQGGTKEENESINRDKMLSGWMFTFGGAFSTR